MPTADKFAERFAYFLKLRGLSLTKERLRILEAVRAMKGHFNVDDLFFSMHGAGRKTSKATLYRTVQLLAECRVIRESTLTGRHAVYELAEPGQTHGHMVCQHCSRVIEFEGPVLDKFIQEASKAQQFLPLTVNVKLMGVCNECVKANPPSLRREVCVPFLKYAQSREN